VPVEVVCVVKATCVPSLVKVTVASATTAPEGSTTVPVTREAVPCASAPPAPLVNRTKHNKNLGRLLIFMNSAP
jgi:hypothetical protein